MEVPTKKKDGLQIILGLSQEQCFDNYTKYMFREKDISLEVRTIIQVANIDCTILTVIKQGVYALSVETGLVEKFANCLKYTIDELHEKIYELCNVISCDEDKYETEFYMKRLDFYDPLLSSFVKQHNLGKCYSCEEYINLDNEHLKQYDKDYCSSICKNIHESSTDCFL
jgi:hypothetical protein